MLGNKEILGRINIAGRISMEKLIEAPSLENFMSCSRDFCINTELANEKIIEIIEAVEAVGGMASQAMLGNTVFAIEHNSKKGSLKHKLADFGNVLHYKTNSNCIKLI